MAVSKSLGESFWVGEAENRLKAPSIVKSVCAAKAVLSASSLFWMLMISLKQILLSLSSNCSLVSVFLLLSTLPARVSFFFVFLSC
jgi:hypothetical protein